MVTFNISIIIPALNELAAMTEARPRLRALRDRGCEVILVDGGSDDGTREVAAGYVHKVLSSARGRATQMNTGASHARGRLLVFLHIDTVLPDGAIEQLEHVLETNTPPVWGRFDVRLRGSEWYFRVIETAMNLRSRWSGIATGDQTLFVDQALFHDLGGFPEIALMEDVALSARLRKVARPRCLTEQVTTSTRKWRTDGVVRTVLLMWWLRLAFALGADPDTLARMYYRPPRNARE